MYGDHEPPDGVSYSTEPDWIGTVKRDIRRQRRIDRVLTVIEWGMFVTIFSLLLAVILRYVPVVIR